MDEVGRGCWAGPAMVGAVLLREPIEGLRDSKLLSRTRREQLDTIIRAEALAWSVGVASSEEIDILGLTAGLALAYSRALGQITQAYDEVVIDGTYNFLAGNPKVRTLVKADQLVPAVSAASIIAKVARDRWMAEAAKTYPQYGFDKHVGYGTAAHLAALQQHGPCALHRRSFAPIQKLVVAV